MKIIAKILSVRRVPAETRLRRQMFYLRKTTDSLDTSRGSKEIYYCTVDRENAFAFMVIFEVFLR